MKPEKRKEAIALSYKDEKHTAPVVVAKGQGLIADKILQEAETNNVPIHEDAALVELLRKINIDEQIPEDLFLAVAEVFAFIYKLDNETEKLKSIKMQK